MTIPRDEDKEIEHARAAGAASVNKERYGSVSEGYEAAAELAALRIETEVRKAFALEKIADALEHIAYYKDAR